MPAKDPPEIRFIGEFSERDAYEAESGGYRSHVIIRMSDGRLYPVLFYSAIRLQQDLEVDAKWGRPFVADPGMIVLPEVTLPAMQCAVEGWPSPVLVMS